MVLISTVIGYSLVAWAIFHIIFNFLLDSKYFGNEINKFCESNNIDISIFQIKYFTNKLNRFLHKLSMYNVKSWFDAGVITCGLLMMVSVLFLFYNLLWAFKEFLTPKIQGQPSNQVLRVIVPGINFPLEDVGFLIIAIFFSGLFHEIGHAVAALREGVKVDGLGVFLIYIYIGAYVAIGNCDHIQARRRLRIFCAGVWHNLILSLVSCCLIFCLPQLLLPLYRFEINQVIIQSQDKMSPLAVEAGLHNGDVLKSIDNCQINSMETWFSCINETIHQSQAGSCLDNQSIFNLSLGNVFENSDNCCHNAPSKSICYLHKKEETEKSSYSCMNARAVLAHQVCHNNNQCKSDEVCAIPYFEDGQRLMKIKVKRDESIHTIIYLGLPHDLFYFIIVTQYQPRWSWLPMMIPAFILQQLRFLFSISIALGMLNIIPCYMLDGEHAFQSFFDEIFGEDHKHKKIICKIVLSAGSLLLALNVCSAFIQVFR